MSDRFDLVLFDLGGVVAMFGRDAMIEVAFAAKIDPTAAYGFWRSGYAPDAPDGHLLHRAERGELSLAEFLDLGEREAPGLGSLFDPASPMGLVRHVVPSAPIAELAREAQGRGVRLGALSNTIPGFDGEAMQQYNPTIYAHVQSLFGRDVLESHRLRARKPDALAFVAATTYFEVEPSRVLFLDDEAVNCEAARAMGMTAVLVVDPDTAVIEARSHLWPG